MQEDLLNSKVLHAICNACKAVCNLKGIVFF